MMSLLYSLVLVSLLALCIEGAKIYGWGVNDYGQLGLSGTVFRYPTPITAYDDKNIVELKASGTYHMAIAANGKVYVSGNNWYGALGLPIAEKGITVGTITENKELENCRIYVGKRHGNAVCGNTFRGWGVLQGYVTGITKGNYGKISNSLASYQLGSNVVDVITGSRFSVITLNNGTMVVAGDGEGGILGLGDTKSRLNFVEFDAFDGIPLLKIFPSHAEHVCALSQTHSLYCWGSNTVGQLGIGNTVNQSRPTLVSFFETDHYVVQVATGLYHTLALTASGRVFAWGLGANGVLGNGVFDNSTFPTPVEVEELKDKECVEIVAGLNFNYVRTASNEWYSWGAGYGGVLGTLTDRDINKPTLVPFLKAFNITYILTASSSRTAYGWLDPQAPTEIIGLPPGLVNECLIPGQVVCQANAHCQDTDRSAICVCDAGYAGDANNCQDVDECASNKVCVAEAVCTNLPGSYNCTCPPNRPVGDGKTTGSRCQPLPTEPPTQAPTEPPTEAPTPAPSDSTTSQQQTTTATSSNDTSASPGTTTGASNGTTTSQQGGDSTTGADSTTTNDGASTTSGPTNDPTSPPSDASTTSASTNGRTNLYQTLFGAKDDIEKPNPTVTGNEDPNIIVNSGKNRDRDVMIGVLIAFGVLMLIVILVAAFLIVRSRRPADS